MKALYYYINKKTEVTSMTKEKNGNGKEFREIKTRLDYVERGIEKTELALNKRLEGMNEFREALKDQSSKFITRQEMEDKLQVLCVKLEALQRLMNIGIGIFIMLQIILGIILAIVK
jgi:hypothetical protein